MFLLVGENTWVPKSAGAFVWFLNYLCIFKMYPSRQIDMKRVTEQHEEKLSSSLLFLSCLLLLTSLVRCSANWLKAELFVSD